MARKRSATDDIYALSRPQVTGALKSSLASGSMTQFYKDVGMRNPSRSYFVNYEGRLHSLKAVVTLAARGIRPEIVSRDFHASDGAQHLRSLKFDVVHNTEADETRREKKWICRLARPGQTAFRVKLIDLYGRCALSGYTTVSSLEAAHVIPASDGGRERLDNEVLLRADLHKLFDTNLIAIDPVTGRVAISALCATDYAWLKKCVLFLPANGPMLLDFRSRWELFQNRID